MNILSIISFILFLAVFAVVCTYIIFVTGFWIIAQTGLWSIVIICALIFIFCGFGLSTEENYNNKSKLKHNKRFEKFKDL